VIAPLKYVDLPAELKSTDTKFRGVVGAFHFRGEENQARIVAFINTVMERLKGLRGTDAKWVFAMELTETQGLHAQFAFYSNTPRPHSQWSKHLGSHQRMQGTWQQAVHYVLKPDSKPDRTWWTMRGCSDMDYGEGSMAYFTDRVEEPGSITEDELARIRAVGCCKKKNCFCEPWNTGEPSHAIAKEEIDEITLKKEDLRPWQRNALNIILGLEAEGGQRICPVFVDTKGAAGKSALCRYLLKNHGALYMRGGKTADLMCQVANEALGDPDTKTEGRRVPFALIDVTRATDAAHLPYATIEQLADGLGTSTKYKSRSMVLNYRIQCAIFTNANPVFERLSADRWMVFTINQDASGEWVMKHTPIGAPQPFFATTVEADFCHRARWEQLGYKFNKPIAGDKRARTQEEEEEE